MSITDYANYIMKFLGIKLEIKYNHKKPEGTYRKLLDSTVAKKYGWTFKTSLEEGLKLTIENFFKINNKYF